MASSSGSSSPLRPLSVGNIVSTAARVYGANLKKYLGVAGVATLWGLLAFGVAVLWIGLIIGGSVTQPTSVGLILFGVLLAIVWIPLAIFCSAYANANAAVISRHAYGELIEQPETIADARKIMLRKKWYLLLIGVMVAIIMAVINIGLTVVFQYIPMFGAMAIFRSSDESSGIVVLVQLIGNFVSLGFYYWFYARWFIPDTVLSIEPESAIDVALGRSWNLSQGSAWRILFTTFVAGLITLPFILVSFVPVFISLLSAIPLLSRSSDDLSPSPISDPQGFFITFGIGLVATMLLFFAANIFLIPFWQTIKTVIYCDLRSRKEGLGLKLRGDRPS